MWEGKPKHAKSKRVCVTHSPGMHGHVPPAGLDHVSDMHGVQVDKGTELDPGITSEVGMHATSESDGLGAPMQTHEVSGNLEVNSQDLTVPVSSEDGREMAMQTHECEVTPEVIGILKTNEVVTNVAVDNDKAGTDVNKPGETAGSPPEFSTPDDAAPSGGIPDDGGHFEAQSAGNTDVGSGKASSQSNGVPKQGRATPYNKGSGGGAIQRLRNRTHRRELSSNRYSHLLSDLRVTEFIQETASIEAKELSLSMRGQSSSLLKETLQPLAGNDGRSVNPIIPALDAQQCKLKPTAADVVGSAAVSSTPPQQVHNSVNDVPIAPASRTDEIATRVDEDGFTMGGAPMYKQHGTRVEVNKEPSVVPIAPKKVNSGFNYSRAVQGSTGSIRQQRDVTHLVSKPKDSRITTSPSARVAHGDGPSKPSSVLGFESANRFSVLDIPTSIMLNKVVEVQDDL
ncbi:hypothetical protein L1987_00003 [Smallanthus sonchifolius]|uniref:Uncharacterized protein n=1 Tax=Smallanthus sonchifolius TaxID=185202 RepID=A0ACB9K192_9ASTR|nr:hypothetical protein L1987_00003 [Smallanthus sonchifolius]